MNKAIIYIHGKGGSAEEAGHYKMLFEEYDVIGFDYKAQTPWDAKKEFSQFFDVIYREHESIVIIANSIGAYFTMNSLGGKNIERTFFISPIVNMERLITDMMQWANVTENKLREKEKIKTDFGEVLSWEYLCYVRENPIKWTIPTNILYGEKDILTSYQTMADFADKTGATITVMKNGEHWFHTEEQMNYLDAWLKESLQ